MSLHFFFAVSYEATWDNFVPKSSGTHDVLFIYQITCRLFHMYFPIIFFTSLKSVCIFFLIPSPKKFSCFNLLLRKQQPPWFCFGLSISWGSKKLLLLSIACFPYKIPPVIMYFSLAAFLFFIYVLRDGGNFAGLNSLPMGFLYPKRQPLYPSFVNVFAMFICSTPICRLLLAAQNQIYLELLLLCEGSQSKQTKQIANDLPNWSTQPSDQLN